MKNKELILLVVAIAAIAIGGVAGFKGNPFKANDITSTTVFRQNTETQAEPENSQGTQSESAGGETYIYDIPEETTAFEAANTYTYTFKSEDRLYEHYEKHKSDTHTSSVDEYLYRANYVITNENSLHKYEADDGDDVYYLESTNEIVFVSHDYSYIRTYFCPDSGKAYFDKQ